MTENETPNCPKCKNPMVEFRDQGEKVPGTSDAYRVPAIALNGYRFTWVCMDCKLKGDTGFSEFPKPLSLDDFEQIGVGQGDGHVPLTALFNMVLSEDVPDGEIWMVAADGSDAVKIKNIGKIEGK